MSRNKNLKKGENEESNEEEEEKEIDDQVISPLANKIIMDDEFDIRKDL